MRSAVLQLPTSRSANERRQVLRAAIRQLERAEIYLAAVDYMDLDDREAQRAVRRPSSEARSGHDRRPTADPPPDQGPRREPRRLPLLGRRLRRHRDIDLLRSRDPLRALPE